MKKIIAIMLLFALALSFVPKEAFCDDHHEPQVVHHHCSAVCHFCFHGVIADESGVEAVFAAAIFDSVPEFSYQNPILTRLKRPPIQLS
jgi:hypothetical protein